MVSLRIKSCLSRPVIQVHAVTILILNFYVSATKVQNLTVVVSDDFYPEDLNTIAKDAHQTTAAPTTTAPTDPSSAITSPTTAPSTAGSTGTTAPGAPTTTTTSRVPVSFKVCETFYGTVLPGQVITFTCPKHLEGRYLTILKTPAVSDPLLMCEVEMFGVFKRAISTP